MEEREHVVYIYIYTYFSHVHKCVCTCECYSLFIKTVETKCEFPLRHSHSYCFLISSVASNAPFWLGLAQEMKSIVVRPTALYLNLVKDFSLLMQLWKFSSFPIWWVNCHWLYFEGTFVQGIQTNVAQDIATQPLLVSGPERVCYIYKVR